MAPVAASHAAPEVAPVYPTKVPALSKDGSYPRQPLQLSGILDKFESNEVTPVIGREYPTIQLRELLNAPNSDELLRELAIVISRRGVVFFRAQDITPEEQKRLTDKLGKVAGKPATSTLHIHPILNSERDGRNAYYSDSVRRTTGADEWHSDITFEPIPADYTSLKVHTLPPTGGDTLWSSGYEIYDLLSPHFKALADGLVGHFAQPNFNVVAQKGGFRVHPGPRGAPENVGEILEAFHPFVRTNPVTGWKSIFGLGSHFQEFKDLSKRESAILKDYILELVTSSHAAQVRFKWSANDLAIWDNRSVYHAATPDYDGLGDRAGVRAVSLGERPYFDPQSRSRREELGNRLI